ncbi:hypothetical protein ES703_14206 [subsurface metagenome]
MSKAGVRRQVRNFDDGLYLVTGKRLRDIGGRVFGLFGEQLAKKATQKATSLFFEELPEDSPYRVLGVNPDAPDFLVKAAYRSHVKRVHPDVGGNPEQFKRIQRAYEQISLLREWTSH